MKRSQHRRWVAVALLAACHTQRVQNVAQPATPPRAQPSVPPTAAKTEPVKPVRPCDSSDRKNLFLLHTDDHQIVLRSSAAECSSVLVPHASGELYDAKLELLWYRDREALRVLDLRTPNAAPVEIARGMPEVDTLHVRRGRHHVEEESGCGAEFVALDWTARPTLDSLLEDGGEAPNLELVHSDWLRAHIKRPLRKVVGKRQEFSEARKMELPFGYGLEACGLDELCGATVHFGSKDLQLVRLAELPPGDCLHVNCLLHDPHTDRWAFPLRPAAFSDAGSVSAGPCGLFLFDSAQTSYLIENWLCSFERGCRKLDGWGIAWLDPGDTAGTPITGNWPEP